MGAVSAFHQSILAQPDADAPRLVFADWLEEQGEASSELVRVQCDLARLSDSDPRQREWRDREADLFNRHQKNWLAPLTRLGLTGRFRRGLLDVSVSGINTFLNCAKDVFEIPWVLQVNLRDASADHAALRALAASPYLERVRSLDLSRSRVGNRGIELLCTARRACRPVALHFNNNNISTYGLQALLEGFDLSRVEELRLSTNGIGEQGVLDLARCTQCTALRTLDLSYNPLRTLGGEYLAESNILRRLKALYVRGASIGARGKKALRRRFGPRVHIGSESLPF